jgi:GNAT superfamily N-acetyltransferase
VVRALTGVEFVRPTEADYDTLITVVDEWWAGRPVRRLLPRLWLRHFAVWSWLARADGDRLVGFAVGFPSPGLPGTVALHLLGVDPNRRRRGIGRGLALRLADGAAAAGADRIETVIPTGDPVALAFLRAVRYAVVADPGLRPIHGVPAHADYDGPGEDRILLVRDLAR